MSIARFEAKQLVQEEKKKKKLQITYNAER